MKNYLTKFSKYLIVRYPLLWNLKLHYILPLALGIHTIFFLWGYFSISELGSLAHTFNIDKICKEKAIIVQLLISTMVLVSWCVLFFRNNSFRDFYPIANSFLWTQWLLIFGIVLLNISYYLSARFGAVVHIKHLISLEQVIKNERTMNDVAFLFDNYTGEKYEFYNRKYPSQLAELIHDNIADINLASYQDSVSKYQGKQAPYIASNSNYFFYKWDTLGIVKDSQHVFCNYDFCYFDLMPKLCHQALKSQLGYDDDLSENHMSCQNPNESANSYARYKIYSDVSPFFQSIKSSYLNYSSDNMFHFYQDKRDKYDFIIQWNDWLTKNDKAHIGEKIRDFLTILKRNKIVNKLPSESGLGAMLKPPLYLLKDEDRIYNDIPVNSTAFYNLNYYFDKDGLNNVYNCIDEAYSFPFDTEFFYVLIYISLCLSLLLTAYRYMGLRILVFSAITVGLCLILIGLLAILIKGNDRWLLTIVASIIYLAFFLISINGTPIFPSKHSRGIAATISLVCIPLMLTVIFLSVKESMEWDTNESLKTEFSPWTNLLMELFFYYLPILIIIFQWFYMKVIQRWYSSKEY